MESGVSREQDSVCRLAVAESREELEGQDMGCHTYQSETGEREGQESLCRQDQARLGKGVSVSVGECECGQCGVE